MQIVSEGFAKAMESKPYMPRMILSNGYEVPVEAFQKIDFTGGSSADDSGVTLGGTVSGAAVVTLDKSLAGDIPAGKGVCVSLDLGLEVDGATEWMPMGNYQIVDQVEDDGILTITANDALATAFNMEYEPLEGFNFSGEDGVDARLFFAALCERRGVTAAAGALKPLYLNASPEGYTERQIIGFIAALYGGYADIDRSGVMHIRWYGKTDKTVDADVYYENGMEKASYDFTVGWMKCHSEGTGEVLVRGDTAESQGIDFECPWMTAEQLDAIWEHIKGFSYRPVTGLEMFGDPRLDPGDIIILKDLAGAEHSVPVMGLMHSWDGGIVTSVNAKGMAKTETTDGPVTQDAKRKNQQLEKEQEEIWKELDNIIVKRLQSILENSTLVIDGASLRLLTGEKETVVLTNQFDGMPIMYMRDYGEDGEAANAGELSPHHIKLGGTSLVPLFYVDTSSGQARLWLNGESSGKTLSWKDNGDGTYTPIGR